MNRLAELPQSKVFPRACVFDWTSTHPFARQPWLGLVRSMGLYFAGDRGFHGAFVAGLGFKRSDFSDFCGL